MAEAFGIASGVAGIISLGFTVCNGLDTYFSAIKDRDDDLKRASEHLTLLREHIELIERNASKLSSRYAQATHLVRVALGLCESEFQALKELVDRLNKVDGSSDVARKWDKSKSVINYPRQRKKLIQVQDQLLKAAGTLGTTVQLLGLNIDVGVGESLEAFRSTVQDGHLVTTAVLRRLESRADQIESRAKQTESALTAISTGIEEQKAVASSSQELIKDTSLMVSEKLDAIAKGSWPGPQSQTAGTAQQNDMPRYLRNAMIESKCVQEYTPEICPCQAQKAETGRQPLTTYRYWGGMTISYQTASKGGHQPGCCFYRKSTKTTITYTGLRYLLSKVLTLSLQHEYQCGGCLTTHSLRTYNVRKTSQAFQIVSTTDSRFSQIDLARKIKNLKTIYTSGEASPLDVNADGYNTAHMCILKYGVWISSSEAATRPEKIEGLKMMLLFLQQVGVDIYAGTNHHSSMLEFACTSSHYSALPLIYDMLANCNSQFDPELDHKHARSQIRFSAKSRFLHMLHDRTDVIEGLGYRNFFLAVAKRDEARLKELIQSAKFAKYVDEMDCFGQNILHFCLNWETGLRLLLEQEATHNLVNQPDASRITLLEYALELSGYACKTRDVFLEPYGVELCSNCSCSATVELLLEADCRVELGLLDSPHTRRASSKATIVLLEHLGQRRKRLHRLGLRHLPETELRDLGVSRNQLPDATAPAIWEKLQSLHQNGLVKELHNGLDPWTGNKPVDQSRRGIFHLLQHPMYAEVAFNLGFKGIDAPDRDGVTPIMHLVRIDLPRTLEHPYLHAQFQNLLLYADWLIEKGARLDDCTNSLGISAAHDLACSFGEWVRYRFLRTLRDVQPSVRIVPVPSALVYSTAQSRLPCSCATEELSRPLHHFVVSSLSKMGAPGPSYLGSKAVARRKTALAIHLVGLLRDIASDTDINYLAKSIIRVLTMGALSIRHLPRCHQCSGYSEEEVQKIKDEEEWDDMLDEDRILVEKLDELTAGFEHEFSNQNLSIEEFLRVHWHPRIRQVQREQRALDESQRQQLLQLGVVLDDKCELDLDYDHDWDLDVGFDLIYGDEDSGDEYSENEQNQLAKVKENED